MYIYTPQKSIKKICYQVVDVISHFRCIPSRLRPFGLAELNTQESSMCLPLFLKPLSGHQCRPVQPVEDEDCFTTCIGFELNPTDTQTITNPMFTPPATYGTQQSCRPLDGEQLFETCIETRSAEGENRETAPHFAPAVPSKTSAAGQGAPRQKPLKPSTAPPRVPRPCSRVEHGVVGGTWRGWWVGF